MQKIEHGAMYKYVNRIGLSILNCGYACVDKEWTGTIYNSVYSRLYYIKSGVAYIRSAGRQMKLQPQNWYLIPTGSTFDYRCDGEMEHVFFHLKLSDFDETDLLRSAKTPLALHLEEENCDDLIGCIKSSCITDGLKMRQSVYEVLIAFIDTYNISINSSDYSPCIFRALQFIKQNLSVQLTISEIAQNVFVSKSTLTKHFQQELSMSVKEYIHDAVMAQALQLLFTTKLSVLAVSERFGFSDQFYFSRCFKKKFGKSPQQMRKDRYI